MNFWIYDTERALCSQPQQQVGLYHLPLPALAHAAIYSKKGLQKGLTPNVDLPRRSNKGRRETARQEASGPVPETKEEREVVEIVDGTERCRRKGKTSEQSTKGFRTPASWFGEVRNASKGAEGPPFASYCLPIRSKLRGNNASHHRLIPRCMTPPRAESSGIDPLLA